MTTMNLDISQREVACKIQEWWSMPDERGCLCFWDRGYAKMFWERGRLKRAKRR